MTDILRKARTAFDHLWTVLRALWQLPGLLTRLQKDEDLWKDQNQRLAQAMKWIQSCTEAHVDWEPRGVNYVVMIGRFRNHDMVCIEPLRANDFEAVVRMLKEKYDFMRPGRLDTPPVCRAIVERDLVPDRWRG